MARYSLAQRRFVPNVPPSPFASARSVEGWGWFPLLCLASAGGLMLVAVAMTAARQGLSWATVLLWAGILLMFAPIALRQASHDVTRGERVGSLMVLGFGLYLVKVVQSPLRFTLHDEYPHWRTANDILASQRLFQENPLQYVSALYPGLEVATVGVASLTGLSLFLAGALVVGVARLLFVVSLYLLYEHVSGSPRLAGVATLLSMTYPNFVYWSSQYAYESLALPLTTMVALAAVRGASRHEPNRAGLWLVALLGIGAVVVTHHLTSFFMTALLILLTMLARYHLVLLAWAGRVGALLAGVWPGRRPRPGASRQRRQAPLSAPATPSTHPPARVALDFGHLWVASLAATLSWLLTVGRPALGYIGPHVTTMLANLNWLIMGEGEPRTPFNPDSATAAVVTVAPLWERALAFGAVGLLLLGLAMGLLFGWRYRGNPVALALMIVASLYPGVQALRLVDGATEISNRLLDFVFPGLVFVVAIGLMEPWRARRSRPSGRLTDERAPTFLIGAWATVVFVGGLVVGTPGWARLPIAYLPGSDLGAANPQTMALASWMRETLGDDNRLIADKSNALVLGSYGEQFPVIGLSWLFFHPRFETDEQAALLSRDVRFIVVDRRLTDQLPVTGAYFESGEPGAGRHREPLPPALLTKFTHTPGLSLLVDTGAIQLYDARPVNHSP